MHNRKIALPEIPEEEEDKEDIKRHVPCRVTPQDCHHKRGKPKGPTHPLGVGGAKLRRRNTDCKGFLWMCGGVPSE